MRVFLLFQTALSDSQSLETNGENKMKEQLEDLIEVYMKHMEYLKNSPDYTDTSKIQTVSVLRNVIDDLKLIINND
mgnify:CR=1 FL=1